MYKTKVQECKTKLKEFLEKLKIELELLDDEIAKLFDDETLYEYSKFTYCEYYYTRLSYLTVDYCSSINKYFEIINCSDSEHSDFSDDVLSIIAQIDKYLEYCFLVGNNWMRFKEKFNLCQTKIFSDSTKKPHLISKSDLDPSAEPWTPLGQADMATLFRTQKIIN